jgi:hypothetical protein
MTRLTAHEYAAAVWLVDDPKTRYRIAVPQLADKRSGGPSLPASPVLVLEGKSEEQE